MCVFFLLTGFPLFCCCWCCCCRYDFYIFRCAACFVCKILFPNKNGFAVEIRVSVRKKGARKSPCENAIDLSIVWARAGRERHRKANGIDFYFSFHCAACCSFDSIYDLERRRLLIFLCRPQFAFQIFGVLWVVWVFPFSSFLFIYRPSFKHVQSGYHLVCVTNLCPYVFIFFFFWLFVCLWLRAKRVFIFYWVVCVRVCAITHFFYISFLFRIRLRQPFHIYPYD